MISKQISLSGLFAGLSVVGASIKIPAIIGSVALDVFPALVAAVMIGRWSGALVTVVGHLVSSLLVGMPLGPFHFIIALEMAFLVWAFATLYEKGKRMWAGLIFIIGNGLIAPLPFIYLISQSFYVAIVPSLLIGSIINAAITFLLVHRFHSMVVKNNIQEAGR
ncbi:ECF transporter S component [Pseudalkalibacillus salsuginis]|uniref:ECF transporter S component n=1 Tax=Pseudalkalibacillus salsuginis TaxID=2910972 RepID=UPI001F28F55B|nr:ECF transporter S component [Pseudalkalibacillus salsuginis]MCF6411674.1 ECF transporter S component [Pseudalkalibacillus salsuginis]